MANTSTALRPREVTDSTTGESLALVPVDRAQEFSMAQYLTSIVTKEALDAQKQLAAAYDAACDALIGENDVQVEGKRSFKKKSAWRKLGRHFRISTEVVSIEREYIGAAGDFLATATVRAVAPWGQSAEAVGACCTDEATGRRVITVADAIATAETRATNRAVSNLIAMGEVSAEEIGHRGSAGDGEPRRGGQNGGQNGGHRGAQQAAQSDPAAFLMPFGRTKGTPLGKLDREDVESALAWATDKGKYVEFQAAATAFLNGPVAAPAAQSAPRRASATARVAPDAGPLVADDEPPFDESQAHGDGGLPWE